MTADATVTPPAAPPAPASPVAPALPRAARRWVGTVVVAGAGAAAAAVWAWDAAGADVDLFGVLVLVVVCVGSIVSPLRVHHDGAVQGFNLVVAGLLALVVTTSWWVSALAVGVACLIGFGWSTRSAVKTAFNTGQSVVWASVAAGGHALVAGGAGGDVFTLRPLLALIVAAVLAVTLNVVLTGELFHRLRGRPRAEVLRDVLAPVTAVTLLGNTVVAILLVVLVERSPIAVVLATPLFGGLVVGYRGWTTERAATRRAEQVQGTTSMLLGAALDDEVFQSAVAGVRGVFGADVAYLDTVAATDASAPDPGEGVRDVVARVWRSGAPVRASEPGSVLAAPVVLGGRVVDVLVVAGRNGLEDWDDGALALLRSIADQVAATVQARSLLDQLELERAMFETESQKLADVLRTASDGIVVLDRDGVVVRCNPAMESVADLDPGEAVGRRWDAVLRLADEAEQPILVGGSDVLARALTGEERVEGRTVRLSRRDGSERWLRCSAAPVQRRGGVDGVVLVVVDVTAEREVEQLRADFLATVSHELRTPLTPLRGFLTVLRRRAADVTPDRLEAMYDSMDRQIGRLEELIADLLAAAEAGGTSGRRDTGPLLVERAVDAALAIEVTGAEAEERVTVQIEPELLADAEAGALVRVVRCLVSNGLKHTDGPVRVEAGTHDGRVRLVVEDDGPGIGARDRELVFEPFRRLGDHLHRTQGPGLGLSIARARCDVMGARLWVEEAASGGARFVVDLAPVTDEVLTVDEEPTTVLVLPERV